MSKEEKAELREIVADERNVTDETENDPTAPPVRYSITSFGSDPDVEALVKRLNRDEIIIPPFQRNYVWSQKEASRLIESLLLGLPVPGIFLAKEEKSNKQLVIDGQQRLKSLQFFYGGYFNPKEGSTTRKIFKLIDVPERFLGLTYETLENKDRIQLDTSIIHATIIKQDSPINDDTSIYHVFERLNSGGRKLVPQEIRTAVSHGPLIELLKTMNSIELWRMIYGKLSPRLKDQELILRFLAMYFDADKYERPISEFLNKFSRRHRYPSEKEKTLFTATFLEALGVVHAALDDKAFRPERSINAAVFDSVMVGVAKRLARGIIHDLKEVRIKYKALLADEEYANLIASATSDEKNVEKRMEKAEMAFAKVK